MHELAGRRGKAYALDCAGYLGIAAAMVPAGVLIARTEWIQGVSAQLLVSAVPPVAATIVAAIAESRHGATLGKRRFALRVEEPDGRPLSFGRALLRNVAKIAVPWQLGHVVAIGAAHDGFERADPMTVVATAVLYPILGVMIGAVVSGSGRAVHDRLAGSVVSVA